MWKITALAMGLALATLSAQAAIPGNETTQSTVNVSAAKADGSFQEAQTTAPVRRHSRSGQHGRSGSSSDKQHGN